MHLSLSEKNKTKQFEYDHIMFTVADPGFQKRGGLLFFFFLLFNRKRGVILQKKPTTKHSSVFNSERIYQNIPLEIPGRVGGGGGVWGSSPRKKLRKMVQNHAILSTSDRHFVQ